MHYLNEPSWLAIYNKYGSNPYSIYPGIIQPISECYFDINFNSIKGLLKFHWENEPTEASHGSINQSTIACFYFDEAVNTEIKIISFDKVTNLLTKLSPKRFKLAAPLAERYIALTNNKEVLKSIESHLHFLDSINRQLVLEVSADEPVTGKPALLLQVNSVIKDESLLEKILSSMAVLHKQLKNS